MGKVLFLKPYSGNKDQNIVRDFVYGCWCNGRRIGGMQMPPINELYAATHVRQAGIDVLFIDAQSQTYEWQELQKNLFTDISIVVVMSSTQSFKEDVHAISDIKSKKPNIKAILFGSHPTFMPKYCLEADVIDYIVLREPEEILRKLTYAILYNQDSRGSTPIKIEDINGIGYRTNSGEIKINPYHSFMNMDDLSIPDRSLLPSDADYFNPVVKKLPYTTMQTSRGCPGRCIFCTAPTFYGNKARVRSCEKVMEELREVKRLGYKEVFFRDETFTAYKKRNIEICEAMIKEGLNLSWIANGRVDMIDKDTMVIMKRAGCHMLKFGVETGNDELLKEYKKGVTCAQAEEVFKWASEAGLDTHAHMVIGGRGETSQTINKTITFVKKLKPTTVSFGILTPYPGTELFDTVAKLHPEIKDGSDSNMENLHTTGFFSEDICQMSSNQLSKYIVMAYRQFYWRPNYILKRLSKIRTLDEMMILFIAGMNIFKFSVSGEK